MTRREPERLDPFEVALDGVRLIEASAGTGKTHNVTALYLRLILETGRPVDRILVVTYTVAATQELQDRIRRALHDAREMFASSVPSEDIADPLLRELRVRYSDRETAVRRLDAALHGFDEAAVHTIHGFCQRVLAERAFESGVPFEAELVPDPRGIVREVSDDYWRKEMHGASTLFAEYVLDKRLDPDVILEPVRTFLARPYLEVRSPGAGADLSASEREYETLWAAARTIWMRDNETIASLMQASPGLNRNKYRATSIPAWIDAMNGCMRSARPRWTWFEKADRFRATTLAGSVKKSGSPPVHPFFDRVEEILAIRDELEPEYAKRVANLRAGLLEWCDAELPRRKRRLRVQSFDDLLLDLDAALSSPRGDALSAAIRADYTAALIDEFQDTDPVQYSIFHRIYGGSGLPVFLVGDPKQAIYSFRGADVFAYLEAREAVAGESDLDTNWRSDPGLITAVNAMFQTAHPPFVLDDIPYRNVQAAERDDREELRVEGEPLAPFRIWLTRREADGPRPGKDEVHEQTAAATAAEIARLLDVAGSGGATIGASGGERSLRGDDIAVLVRSHRQGTAIRDALAKLGVASVQYTDDNVFASREAMELERVLWAVAEPGRDPRVRAALATEMLGFSADRLQDLSEDVLEDFRDYREIWRRHGVVRMLRSVMVEFDVAQRLLAYRDGDRRLTNLNHLAELVHAGPRGRAAIEDTLTWLAERRAATDARDETQQLRLESDEDLVRVVTVHKSKGLEYGVVYLPFAWWARSDRGDRPNLFHRRNGGWTAVLELDPGADGDGPRLARREQLAEELRLLYVALTRARHRATMVWGPVNGGERSAPAWLLHALPAGADDPTPEEVADRVEGLDDAGFREDLDRLVERAAGSVVVEPMPSPGSGIRRESDTFEPSAQIRRFGGTLEPRWKITSFTALTRGRATERPDHDAYGPAVPEDDPHDRDRDISHFPAGARAGSCLHAIFERLDFRAGEVERRDRVEQGLSEFGFDTAWTEIVDATVGRVLETRLDDGGRLRLGEIPTDRRLNELEFTYPVAGLTDDGMRRVLREHAAGPEPFLSEIERLRFEPVGGYLTGFIDLVFESGGRFHVVDYKSNRLGAGAGAYARERLDDAMARESYVLQYLLYTVAVHRWLERRFPDYDYDRQFGGVYYLFVRGIEPALGPSSGIYHDRPARALVEALDRYLRGAGGDG